MLNSAFWACGDQAWRHRHHTPSILHTHELRQIRACRRRIGSTSALAEGIHGFECGSLLQTDHKLLDLSRIIGAATLRRTTARELWACPLAATDTTSHWSVPTVTRLDFQLSGCCRPGELFDTAQKTGT